MELKPLSKEPQTLYDIERQYILRTMITLEWNRTHAARALGISIRGLRNKLNEYRKQGYPTTAHEMAIVLEVARRLEGDVEAELAAAPVPSKEDLKR